MKRFALLMVIVAVLLTASGCYVPFIGEWQGQQDIKANKQIEREVLENLVPAERFEITNKDGRVLLTEDDVKDVKWQWHSMNMDSEAVPAVILTFTEDGTKKFATATQMYYGQELPILIDGEEIGRPIVNEIIIDGAVILSGDNIDSYETAVRIAARIQSTKN